MSTQHFMNGIAGQEIKGCSCGFECSTAEEWREHYRQTLKSSASSRASTMRRFVLVRAEDVSGTSGTGVVAEGVEFSNGSVAIHWISQLESMEICANMHVVDQIHGHGGRTSVQWVDE